MHALPTGIFAGLLLLLIALELFNQHSPYNTRSTGAKFMWAYAPVGILMIVNWIWTAYDLQIKTLVPWAAISRRATLAEQSWLLDYIGVNPIVIVLTAFRYRTSPNRTLLSNFDPSILAEKHYVNEPLSQSQYLGRQVLNLSRTCWTTKDDFVVAVLGDFSGVVAV
ncbi:hypothetical protein C8R44DRAFT_730281 [Mycena epipterygia]|nr:hypothetical protein C8R44DRAFT_730281 [Mycena epipterygia]